MIDNETGKAARVSFQPMRLDTLLRTNTRDQKLLSGWLLMNLIEAAQRLAPEFVPDKPKPTFDPGTERPLTGFPSAPSRVQSNPLMPFMPRWRRWVSGVEDDDGGI